MNSCANCRPQETKPFARASKAVYQPGAGPVDEKSNSSLSEMAIQPLRASSKNDRHHNSTAQHGIQKFQTTGPRQLTVYLENFNIRHATSAPNICRASWLRLRYIISS